MLNEILQCASRAHATSVRVAWDVEQRMLAVIDDGAGIQDPASLIVGETTTQDANRAMARSDLGFYSLLDDRLVESVHWESQDWAFTICPEDMAVGEIRVQQRRPRTGTRVVLILRVFDCPLGTHAHGAEDILLEMLHAMVGLHAFKVSLVSGLRESVTVVTTPFRIDQTLSLACGTLELNHDPAYPFRGTPQVVRDGAVLSSHSLSGALRRAARAHPDAQLASDILQTQAVRWHASPACYALTEHPHRDDLDDTSALAEASRIMVDAMVAHFRATASDAFANAPRQMTLEEARQRLPGCPPELLCTLLRALSWQWVDLVDLANEPGLISVRDTDYTFEPYALSYFDMDAIAVPSEALAQTLIGHGISACHDPDARKCHIACSGLVESNGSIWHADSIILTVGKREFRLRFLLNAGCNRLPGIRCTDNGVQPLCIWTESVGSLARMLGEATALRHAAALYIDANEHQTCDWVIDEHFDFDGLAGSLLDGYVKAYAPEHVEAHRVSRDCAEAVDQLNAICQSVDLIATRLAVPNDVRTSIIILREWFQWALHRCKSIGEVASLKTSSEPADRAAAVAGCYMPNGTQSTDQVIQN